MGGGVDRLLRQLVTGRLGRRGSALVHPHPGQRPAVRVGDVRGARRAGLGARGDALAVLRHHARPLLVAGAQALEHLLQVGRLARGVAGQGDVPLAVGALGAPLRAEEDQVHPLVAGGDADPVVAAAVADVVGRGRLDGVSGGGGGGDGARVLPGPAGHAGGGSPGGDGAAAVEVAVGRRVGVGDAGVAGGDGLRRPARLRRGGGRLRHSARGQQRHGRCGATGGPPPGTVRQAQCSSPRRPVNAGLLRCAAPRAGTAAGASRCRRTVTEAHYAAFSPALPGRLPNRVHPGRNGTGSLSV